MSLRWSPGYAAVDADFDSVSLLLYGDGTNGSTTIVDSSPSPKTVTPAGDAQISTAIADPFGNTGGVLAFDGTGDYLDLSTSADFAFGTQDYTVEGWLFQPSPFTINTLIDFRGGGTGIAVYSSINDSSLNVATNSEIILTASTSFLPSTWTHWAVVRQDLVIRAFINGVFSGSVNDVRSLVSNTCRIGSNIFLSQDINGYISNLRVTKGAARYTSNFIPPTAPFPDISPTTRLAIP